MHHQQIFVISSIFFSSLFYVKHILSCAHHKAVLFTVKCSNPFLLADKRATSGREKHKISMNISFNRSVFLLCKSVKTKAMSLLPV